MELRTSQIHFRLSEDYFTSQMFLGVFSRDMLPEIKKYPSCLVLNTDNSSLPGSHWLAIFFDEKKKCTFFDSFGMNPEKFRLDGYLKRYSISIEYNSQRLQASNSSTCGYYCISFLQLKSRNYSLEDIIDLFNTANFDLNDFIITNILF